MGRLSFFKPEAHPAVITEPERAKLHKLIDTLPIEKVREVLTQCKEDAGG